MGGARACYKEGGQLMFLDFDVKVSVGKIAEVQSIDTRSRYELAPLEENEITGTVPLSFTARMGRLTGYKIYGNSRHEESPNLIIDWLSKISTTYQCPMEKTATSLTIHRRCKIRLSRNMERL